MASIINAATSGGLISTGDTSGQLQLQTAGTTALTIDSSQNVGIGTNTISAPNGRVYNLQIGTNNAGSSSELLLGHQGDGFSLFTSGGSGAGALSFSQGTSEKMRINYSGALLVNSTANLSGAKVYVAGTGGTYLAIGDAGNASYRGMTILGGTGDGTVYGSIRMELNGGQLQIASGYSGFGGFTTFYTNGSEAMRIDTSQNLLVGTTTNSGSPTIGMVYLSAGSTGSPRLQLAHASGTASGGSFLDFLYNGTTIGSVTQNGTTGVLYNLTSDYRLKNNPVALTGAKDFVMALQPKTWDWYDNSGKGVGFVAHEFMEVAKYSGHGEKDAVETVEIKDKEGNVTGTEQRPIYQAIQPSSSEVMANLVAFIQELSTQVTELKAEVQALKGA